MKKILRIILVLLSVRMVLYAQIPETNESDNVAIYQRKHSITVMPQLDIVYQKDEVLSLVPRRGNMFAGILGYRFDNGKIMFRVNLDGGAGTVESVTGYNKGLVASGTFNFTNLYKLPIHAKTFRFLVGGSLIFGMDGIPYENSEVLRMTWHVLLSIGPTGRVEWAITPKLELFWETGFPSLGILWRPHAQGYNLYSEEVLETKGFIAAMFENPRFSSFHTTFEWINTFGASLILTPTISLLGHFLLNYTYIDVPRPKYSMSSSIGIGVQFKLREGGKGKK